MPRSTTRSVKIQRLKSLIEELNPDFITVKHTIPELEAEAQRLSAVYVDSKPIEALITVYNTHTTHE